MELDERIVDVLHHYRCTTPRILHNLGDASITLAPYDAPDDVAINPVEQFALIQFQGWMKWYIENKTDNGSVTQLPKNLTDWQDAFTEETLEEFIESDDYEETYNRARNITLETNPDAEERFNNGNDNLPPPRRVRIAQMNQNNNDNSSSDGDNSKRSDDNDDDDDSEQYHDARTKQNTRSPRSMKVSLDDYPDFDGKHANWNFFKREMIAVCGLAKKHDLLKLTTERQINEHKARRLTSPAYNNKVIEFHSILTKKTSRGVASSHVDKYLEEQDGVQAWNELVSYYDHSGNKERRILALLKDLMDQQLRHDSYGGFDKYHNKFNTKCQELDIIYTPLDDLLKKLIFINGIVDDDYKSIKDTVWDQPFLEAVEALRQKGTGVGQGRRQRQLQTTVQAQRQQQRQRQRRWPQTRQEEVETEQQQDHQAQWWRGRQQWRRRLYT